MWQVGDAVALARYVDVYPDCALSDASHARVVNKRLVHRVYAHTAPHCCQLNNNNNINSCPSCPRALWTRQTRWQTSRRANLNPMAPWPFVSLGRYSRQPISCFLYVDRAATDAGTVADMTTTRKTEKYSTHLQHTGSSL